MVMEKITTFEKPLLLTNLSLKLSDFCTTGNLSDDCQKECKGLKLFDIVGERCSVSFRCFYDAKNDCVEELFKYLFSHFVRKVVSFEDLLTKEEGNKQRTKTVSVEFSKCQVEQELPCQFLN